MRVTGGQQHGLDRPGQVVVQPRQRGAVIGAEAQHHALLVRLHAVEAAGQPERRRPRPPAATPRRRRGRAPPARGGRPRAAAEPGRQHAAHEALDAGDQFVEVGRGGTRRSRAPAVPRPLRPARPPARAPVIAAAGGAPGTGAARPAAGAVVGAATVPRHEKGSLLCGAGRARRGGLPKGLLAPCGAQAISLTLARLHIDQRRKVFKRMPEPTEQTLARRRCATYRRPGQRRDIVAAGLVEGIAGQRRPGAGAAADRPRARRGDGAGAPPGRGAAGPPARGEERRPRC